MSKMKQIKYVCDVSHILENINLKCLNMQNSNKKWREAQQFKKGYSYTFRVFPPFVSLLNMC